MHTPKHKGEPKHDQEALDKLRMQLHGLDYIPVVGTTHRALNVVMSSR